MDKDKQINEIARLMCSGCGNAYDTDKCFHGCCPDWENAESIYNAGYRKKVKGVWIDLPDNGNGWYQNGQLIHPKSCSACGDVYSRSYAYCPSCGSIMENN
jgi:predicted amidophosphoribosyltransferase